MNDGDDIQDLIQKKTTLLCIATYFTEQSWAKEKRKKTQKSTSERQRCKAV